MGVVEEGTIPYTTEGLAKKKENQEHWLERDPKITCFLPGVANEVWAVEGGTPNTLLRRGLRRDSITPGMVIIVDGYQNKDRSARANGRDVTFEDGRKFFLGSSGTGAPRDGRDPAERNNQ